LIVTGVTKMTDLSDFIETPHYEHEQEILIKSGCTFEEVRSMAIHCRTTHPNESVQWRKDTNNTYTLNRVVKSNGT
jgi:hypothetical protein